MSRFSFPISFLTAIRHHEGIVCAYPNNNEELTISWLWLITSFNRVMVEHNDFVVCAQAWLPKLFQHFRLLALEEGRRNIKCLADQPLSVTIGTNIEAIRVFVAVFNGIFRKRKHIVIQQPFHTVENDQITHYSVGGLEQCHIGIRADFNDFAFYCVQQPITFEVTRGIADALYQGTVPSY